MLCGAPAGWGAGAPASGVADQKLEAVIGWFDHRTS